jgi:hypothetical protein
MKQPGEGMILIWLSVVTLCPFDAADHLCNDFTLRFSLFLDVTAVCILEGFQNQQSMLLADKVLKLLGKEKAKEKYKVN